MLTLRTALAVLRNNNLLLVAFLLLIFLALIFYIMYRGLKRRLQTEKQQGADELAKARRIIESERTAAETELAKIKQCIAEEAQEQSNMMEISAQRSAEAAHADEKALAAEKRLTTLSNKYKKYKGLFDSVLAAMDTWANGSPAPVNDINALRDEFSSVIPADIKALSMKDLRAQFKENTKNIEDACRTYQDKYTSKVNTTIYRLVVLALEEGVQNIYHSMAFGRLDSSIAKLRELTSKCFDIAVEGNQTIVSTLSRFIGQVEYLYIESIRIEYEYYVKRERAKEEQRAIREQMRQEAEERKALEQQRRQVENEEKKYHNEISRLQEQMAQSAEAEEIALLKQRLSEVESLLSQVEEKKDEIISLQNGKAGTVYIISNLGSFGDNTFKIGMTRRLEPMDRVRELGDASVPFPFDVHSLIFSEDAVALESALHKELAAQRVNKINLRKEFFNVTIDALEELVNRVDPSAAFERTMLAEQYHQSLSIEGAVEFDENMLDDENEGDFSPKNE